MSGHSKWATTKHKKAATDKARGKLFAKLIRQVEVAAREGGGDINANATLRTMYSKAREASVPSDTIERAIKRGTGELEGVRYESVSYEGYGPAGTAVMVDCLTDNRNRTGAEIRSLFSRAGGSMAEPGAVAWQFERKGLLAVARAADEDELTLTVAEAGGEDVADQGEYWEVTCAPAELSQLRGALEEAGYEVSSAELAMVPTTTVRIEEEGDARKVLRLLDALEEHDDVQSVWSNFELADALVELVEA